MRESIWNFAGIAAAVALVAGVSLVASAMQPVGGAPARDPTRVTVIKRQYDRSQLIKPSSLSEDAYRGRTIWLQRCAYCHDGVGNISYNTMGPWLGAETVQTLTEVAVRAIITAGTERMPGFSYALQPKQMDDLLAFMKTIPASTKPTPEQLAGGRLTGAGARGVGGRAGGAGAAPVVAPDGGLPTNE
jgi:mono/diheme cytochrome c family protein